MTKRLISAALAAALLAQGCATGSRPPAPAPVAAASPAAAHPATAACPGPACGEVLRIAQRTEVPLEKDAPQVKDHPLTSVVVTQCNLIVAVYMTMQDGRLLRFDQNSKVPADQLMQMAYTATRSERVEVSCNDSGTVGYETHNPV
jgi:hypothetical protein